MTSCKGLFQGSSAVERLTVNQGVAGSNPALEAKPEVLNLMCTSVKIRIPADQGWSWQEEFRTNVQHNFDYGNQDYSDHDYGNLDYGSLAQLGERLLYTQDVGGSNPSRPTIQGPRALLDMLL